MGWFWGADDNKKPESGDQDPLRRLDAELREFLKKESPVKYEPGPAPIPSPAQTAPAKAKQGEVPVENKVKTPSQSLYKDGRYAHLWATYQPQSVVEASGKSDQEKMSDVIDGFKERKRQIGKAALENCALEQSAVNDCFKAGGWAARATMCSEENKKFNRCYTMQSRFLKALGYLAIDERPAGEDERIQMHADSLYHRMLAQEEATEAARAAGRAAPMFPPLISNVGYGGGTESPSDARQRQLSALPARVKEEMRKKLEPLNEKDREYEEKALLAELVAGEQMAERLNEIQRNKQSKKAGVER